MNFRTPWGTAQRVKKPTCYPGGRQCSTTIQLLQSRASRLI